ncbi:MAG: carbon monoxide dehydrogenase subunit G [Proteobacteria bacterium]|nr:carbon monoxide dehydrogenase subunit G [Pseudomonadota bacterium]
MEFTGRYVIPARPQAVWAGINDPAVLKACVPGCQKMEKTSPTDFEATAKLKIGPVSATFKGKVALLDLVPPHRLTLKGEGQGGVAGFARGEAEVVLTPEGDGTVLTYTAKANVGGKLAQIGQRLIDGAAKQIADDFFSRFAATVGAPAAPADAQQHDDSHPVPQVAHSAGAPAPGRPTSRREGVAPEIWVVGLIAIVVILIVIFSALLP